MSALALFLGDYLAGKALDAATKIVCEPHVQFEEIRRRHGAEAMFELDLALNRHVREQQARDTEFATKLREKITEREVCALFPVMLRAAAESSVRERMRMLCAALAGILRPELDAEMRSRVARAVLQLEPSDVLYLRDLQEMHPFRLARLKPPSGACEPALVSTGCLVVRVEEEDIGKTLANAQRDRRSLRDVRMETRNVRVVTDVGSAVVASLRAWTPEPPCA